MTLQNELEALKAMDPDGFVEMKRQVTAIWQGLEMAREDLHQRIRELKAENTRLREIEKAAERFVKHRDEKDFHTLRKALEVNDEQAD